jgi:hypothetical protein
MNIPRTFLRLRELYTFRHEPEYVRPITEIFWLALLAAVAAGAVGVVLFGVGTFWSVTSILSAPPGPARLPTVLDRAALDETLSTIEEKKRDFNTRKASPTPVADPSR